MQPEHVLILAIIVVMVVVLLALDRNDQEH